MVKPMTRQPIQRAINAAGSAGCGSVVFNVARYFTTGTLVVPAGVVLAELLKAPLMSKELIRR